jgi:hypothetical protein
MLDDVTVDGRLVRLVKPPRWSGDVLARACTYVDTRMAIVDKINLFHHFLKCNKVV